MRTKRKSTIKYSNEFEMRNGYEVTKLKKNFFLVEWNDTSSFGVLLFLVVVDDEWFNMHKSVRLNNDITQCHFAYCTAVIFISCLLSTHNHLFWIL